MNVQGKSPLSPARSDLLKYLESLASQIKKAVKLEWEMTIDHVMHDPYEDKNGLVMRDDTGQRELTLNVRFTVPKEKSE